MTADSTKKKPSI